MNEMLFWVGVLLAISSAPIAIIGMLIGLPNIFQTVLIILVLSAAFIWIGIVIPEIPYNETH